MKKIVIAVAAIVLATFTQAATVDWSIFEISSPTDNSGMVSDLAVYFIDSSVISQSAAMTALASGDFSILSSAFSGDVSVDGEAYATAGVYGNLQTVTGYAVVFDTAAAADAKNFIMTEEVSATTGGAGQPASIEFYATNSADAGNWTAVSVPEPTSGLLLLLGMAGLALRRKQA